MKPVSCEIKLIDFGGADFEIEKGNHRQTI
jgi:hypothetical protein